MAGREGATGPAGAGTAEERTDSGAPSPLRSGIRELALSPGFQADGSACSPVDRLHPADEDLLEALETALRDPTGVDRVLDAAEVAKCLGMRSVELAGCVIAALGGESDGHVRADGLLAGVKRLLYSPPRDRRAFAFRIHDLDGDGRIDHSELRRMIALGFAEDDVTARVATADRLAGLLLRQADSSHDGKISFAEFDAALDRYPDVAAAIEKSGVRWLLAREDADRSEFASRTSLAARVRRVIDNRTPYVAFLMIWTVANVLFFEHARRAYEASNGFVQLARGCGACLNFNGALILLPMMRRGLTALRRTWFHGLIPLDDAVELHAVAGHAMFAFALAHTVGHLGNYARTPGVTVAAQVASIGAARTGVVWLLVFGVMWFFARASARSKRKFEVFHATHSLYVLWFIVGLLHGPVFWKWVALPIAAFLVERAVRFARRSAPAEILRTRVLRSGVTRLDLRKPAGFQHRAGDFVFLRIPRVAEHEWHPLTISSAPERDLLSFHVRALGDWSSAVRRLAETRQSGHSSEALVAAVDGPYGAPCAGVFESRRAVLIAGGIGVTPFASVLESIALRSRSGAGIALERVDFVWMNRDAYSFEWFFDLLSSIDKLDDRGLVRIHVYMTGGRSDASSAAFDLARRAALLAGETDVVTGLKIETHMGAPDWPAIFASMAVDAGEVPVDVYFCGPPGLARKVGPCCEDAGMTFRQERF